MKKVIVTLGPAVLYNNSTIKEMDNNGFIYRINGAHGNIESVKEYIKEIRRQFSDPSILIDLPGNKIRTKNLIEPIRLQKNKKFRLTSHQTNYKDFFKYVKKDDVVLADDSTLKFVVEDVSDDGISFISESEGLLLSNKGLHIKGVNKELPFLFEIDKELIDIAYKYKISHLGLSFVRTVDDINEAQEMIDKNITIIAKVETMAAVENITDILQAVDYILIDRGDLSTEVGLEKIPYFQKYIIEKALFYNKKIFLATQFLKSMVERPIPSIAEIIDLYNTFKQGVYGIQLSEETAVGKYPMECLEVIKKMIQEIDLERK